ncbi:MAG: aminotransferase class I/II-fold pyridoxal phosphate-dependent enzyme [Oscillospiraceae bacterium]|nr:aminotransferase class I/II-fold pyridoxal phosphate-dependent enzyme [Oscillospiraceae bacterium]
MLIHGGDLTGFEEKYGLRPLDFSVNTNPFGLSPMAAEALSRATERASEYPDVLYRRLRSAIASHEAVGSEQVVCGNGAAELIWRICLTLRPRKALLAVPCFAEYEAALRFAGSNIEYHYLRKEKGFVLGNDILPQIKNADIVFLCSPNNPTGLCINPGLLSEICSCCNLHGTTLVMDECFLGFLPDGEKRSLKSHLSRCPGLIILKAFTKLYGMAGLRLGYALCGDCDLAGSIMSAGQCWPISTAAEDAGIAALSDTAFVKKTLAFLPDERRRVKLAMEKLGLDVYPGEANFLFFRSDLPHLGEALAERGILIRRCGNYPGLDGSYYRAAILTGEKNDRLLAALNDIRR